MSQANIMEEFRYIRRIPKSRAVRGPEHNTERTITQCYSGKVKMISRPATSERQGRACAATRQVTITESKGGSRSVQSYLHLVLTPPTSFTRNAC